MPRDDLDEIDLKQAANRAHAICGALSTISYVDPTTPEEFWATFKGDPAVVDWLDDSIAKLSAIRAGMPAA